MTYDCLIIGAGPAGLSAALQCQHRGLSALLIGNPTDTNPLAKAERVDNYLGLPYLSGAQLLETMSRHLAETDAFHQISGRALSAMYLGDHFCVSVGTDIYCGRTLLLCTGIARGRALPGEERLLGKGLSYCASCDGMLYRERDVAVLGFAQDAPQEAAMLDKIGCHVTYIAPRRPDALPLSIPYIKATRLEILGEDKVTGVQADGRELPFQGVFLLRDTVAPTALLPGLAIQGGYVQVDADLATNLPGVFAAGDCTGQPLQIAKAVGQGQLAVHSAQAWLEENK